MVNNDKFNVYIIGQRYRLFFNQSIKYEIKKSHKKSIGEKGQKTQGSYLVFKDLWLPLQVVIKTKSHLTIKTCLFPHHDSSWPFSP